MSSSSASNSEYPGVSRLIVEWTDPDEIAFNWPFNANGREVRSVTVDGVEYVDAEKLKAANGELRAEVNGLEKRIAELEAGRTCRLFRRACYGTVNGVLLALYECSECGEPIEPKDGWNYCPNCGAKVVDA